MKKIFALITTIALLVTAVGITASADYYTARTTLQYGMQGPEVTNLQNDLRAAGCFANASTGFFGALTKAAVIKFQQENALPADGIVGRTTARALKVDNVLTQARGYLGVPYVYGGTSPSGFDCSGFVHYTLYKNDITVPRTAATLYGAGTSVAKSALKPGDLVFFTSGTAPDHVGFYLGGGQFIHASVTAGKIIVSALSNTYYAAHYYGARRIIG